MWDFVEGPWWTRKFLWALSDAIKNTYVHIIKVQDRSELISCHGAWLVADQPAYRHSFQVHHCLPRMWLHEWKSLNTYFVSKRKWNKLGQFTHNAHSTNIRNVCIIHIWSMCTVELPLPHSWDKGSRAKQRSQNKPAKAFETQTFLDSLRPSHEETPTKRIWQRDLPDINCMELVEYRGCSKKITSHIVEASAIYFRHPRRHPRVLTTDSAHYINVKEWIGIDVQDLYNSIGFTPANLVLHYEFQSICGISLPPYFCGIIKSTSYTCTVAKYPMNVVMTTMT